MNDIRLKLYLHCVTGKPPNIKLTVQAVRDWAAAPVEIFERDVDYVYPLQPGSENYFFIPESIAKRVGLMAEKGDFLPNGGIKT